uniref:Uncharacterized protein n=1 Tax=Rhizophora mucronata TaxID=61149 RepID=A0A2P2Q131_RHIMU
MEHMNTFQHNWFKNKPNTNIVLCQMPNK